MTGRLRESGPDVALRPESPGSEWHLIYENHEFHEERKELTTSIVFALAEATGVDPIDIRRPLYRSLDVNAIDSLFQLSSSERTTSAFGFVGFTYEDHRIIIESDGTIRIYENSH